MSCQPVMELGMGHHEIVCGTGFLNKQNGKASRYILGYKLWVVENSLDARHMTRLLGIHEVEIAGIE